MEERIPEMNMMGAPIWCHHHCGKMKLVATSLCKDTLIIQGSAAELIIRRINAAWLVSWRVIQSPTEQTMGQAQFSNDQLLSAFRLGITTEKYSEWLLQRYGGGAASQGKFVRYKNWLNIPCPGTGHDGDPNISIEIDEDMRKAVADLVYHSR